MKGFALILALVLAAPLLWGGAEAALSRSGGAEAARTRRLPEVIVQSRRKDANVMHIAGIIREYSFLQTHFDTVFLFRDKLVDFMIPLPSIKKFYGWKTARILRSDSYYQFFDYNGRDSVSDRYYLNFSLGNRLSLPSRVIIARSKKDNPDFTIALIDNPDAETWQPGVSSFLTRNTDVNKFDVRYFFENVEGMDLILPVYISKADYTLESYGTLKQSRLPGLANRPYQVNTKAELYITDRNFITVKEAKKFLNSPTLALEKCEFTSMDVPPLPAELQELVERVNAIDHLRLRLDEKPDSILKGFYYTHPAREINFRNWIRGMVGLPALSRKMGPKL